MNTKVSLTKSFPFHGSKGANSCNLVLVGAILTSIFFPSVAGGWYVSCPGSNPLAGSCSPVGGLNLNFSPLDPVKKSFSGLKVISPAIARAVTI